MTAGRPRNPGTAISDFQEPDLRLYPMAAGMPLLEHGRVTPQTLDHRSSTRTGR